MEMVTKQSLLTTWITTEREREPELRFLLSDQPPASKSSAPPLQNFLDPPLTVLVLVLNLTSMIMGLERITGNYMEDIQMSSYSQVINMHKAVHTRSFST